MTPDQKMNAWARFVAAELAHDATANNAAKSADTLLALMEQREREGRFGQAESPGNDAEHQRLRRDLHDVESERNAERKRADKTESLLKEAQRALRAWQRAWNLPGSRGGVARVEANDATKAVLARARQEGFSDGE